MEWDRDLVEPESVRFFFNQRLFKQTLQRNFCGYFWGIKLIKEPGNRAFERIQPSFWLELKVFMIII